MKFIYLLLSLICITFSIYGGYDDSPGGLLLGAVLAVVFLIIFIRKIEVDRKVNKK